MDAQKTRALITGATSGLGRETAVQLGRRGWRVAITGRRREQLEETARLLREAGGEPLVLQGSVSDPAQVKSHYAAIVSAWGGLDWVLLNAGISERTDAREFSAETVKLVLDSNLMGVAYWMEAVLPGMIAQGSGLLAGVSSLASFRGLPRTGAYSASKAGLNALLESARVDLIRTGVKVVTVCPGFVKTEITERNDPKAMPFLMEVEDAVSVMLAGIDARKRVVHFPWQISYLTKYVLGGLPDFLYDRIAAKLERFRKKRPKP
jgi:NAD(P)-dependent dehydrogenase (short-subunit alcohol dehydrogenase family)